MVCSAVYIILILFIVKFSTQRCYMGTYRENPRCSYYYLCSEDHNYVTDSYVRTECAECRSNLNLYDEINCYLGINLLDVSQYAGQTRRIQIYSSNIQKVDQNLFDGFPNLEALTMAEDNISNSNIFPDLFQLKALNLSRNAIQTLSKTLLTSPTLTTLDLSQNSINIIEENALLNTKLKILLLQYNKLENASLIFENCYSLTELDISNNYINQIKMHAACSNLLYMNASHNEITEFGINAIQSLKVVILDLSWNNLTVSSQTLEHLNYLEILHLGNNPLFELPMGLLQNKSRLQYLNLSSTHLSSITIGSFAKLEKLQLLDLSHNHLSSLPKGFFHDLLQLKELYLNDNRFIFIEYNGLGKLSKISIDNNGLWSCDTLANIIHNLLQRRVRIVQGSAHATENILGIKCAATETNTTEILLEDLPAHTEKDNYTLLYFFLQNMQKLFAQQQNLSTQLAITQHQQLEQTIENTLYKIGSIFESGNKISTDKRIDLTKIENATINRWTAFQTNFSEILREDRIKFAKDIKNTLNLFGSKAQENHNAILNSDKKNEPITSTEKEIVTKAATLDLGINENYKAAMIAGVYSTFFILLVFIILLLVSKFRACNIIKYNLEETNPLNNI